MAKSKLKDSTDPNDYEFWYFAMLSGILGIHPDPNDGSIKDVALERFSETATITFSSNKIRTLQTTINLKTKTINNDMFVGEDGAKGIAYERTVNQVTWATLLGYRVIEGWAYRGTNTYGFEWTGYRIWQFYGYLMQDVSYPKFMDILNNGGRTEKSIHELCSTKDGYEFWKEKGDSWYMFFDLDNPSLSRDILKANPRRPKP